MGLLWMEGLGVLVGDANDGQYLTGDGFDDGSSLFFETRIYLTAQSRNLLSRTASPAMAMPAFQTLASTATIRVSSRAMSCLVANCSLIGMASAAGSRLVFRRPRVNQRIVDFAHHDFHGFSSELVQFIPWLTVLVAPRTVELHNRHRPVVILALHASPRVARRRHTHQLKIPGKRAPRLPRYAVSPPVENQRFPTG